MAKLNKESFSETFMELSPITKLNNSAVEIVQACVATSGVILRDQHKEQRICTKRDNHSKSVMKAHMAARAKTRSMV